MIKIIYQIVMCWKVLKVYKTIVIKYSPKADVMAQKIEETANEMLEKGYELITMKKQNSKLLSW